MNWNARFPRHEWSLILGSWSLAPYTQPASRRLREAIAKLLADDAVPTEDSVWAVFPPVDFSSSAWFLARTTPVTDVVTAAERTGLAGLARAALRTLLMSPDLQSKED